MSETDGSTQARKYSTNEVSSEKNTTFASDDLAKKPAPSFAWCHHAETARVIRPKGDHLATMHDQGKLDLNSALLRRERERKRPPFACAAARCGP